MSSPLIVVTGASGNIGSQLADILLSKGKKVRVVGRDAKKLAPFVQKGAEAFVGNAENPEDMKRAFAGAKAVFALIPPNYAAQDFRAYQNKVGQNYADAIVSAGVQDVVNLSSVGAHLNKGNGPIAGLYDQEQRLNSLKDSKVLNLRPGFFMENMLWNISLIKNRGVNGSPMRGDLPVTMIATHDIATYAAVQIMTGLDRSSNVELLGQREITQTEATSVIGNAIGKPDLKYVQFPYDEAEKSMLGMGMSKSAAEGLLEMQKGFNEGAWGPSESRGKHNTTVTSIEEFAKTFAEIYNKS
jgi:uncharacterized protein YbjT (DUF2867 family)